MNGNTTITTKGQVTIPSEVRKMLNISVGDKVSFGEIEVEERKIILKIIPKNIVSELAGSLSSKIRNSNYKKVREITGKLLAKKYITK